MFGSIITFYSDDAKQFFFSISKDQKHGFEGNWEVGEYELPIVVEPVLCVPNGMIDSEEKFIKYFYGDYTEIENPNDKYKVAGRVDFYAIAHKGATITPTDNLEKISTDAYFVAPGSLFCNETGFGIYDIEINENPSARRVLGEYNITYRRENDFRYYPLSSKNFTFINVKDIDKIRKSYIHNPICLKDNGDVIEVDLETFVTTEMKYFTKFPLGDNYLMYCDNRPSVTHKADKPNLHASIIFMLGQLNAEIEEPVEQPMFLYDDVVIAHRRDIEKIVDGEKPTKTTGLTTKEIVDRACKKIHNAILDKLNTIYPMRRIDPRKGWLYAGSVNVDNQEYSFVYSDSLKKGTFRCMESPSYANHWFTVDIDKERSEHSDNRHYYINFRTVNGREEDTKG